MRRPLLVIASISLAAGAAFGGAAYAGAHATKVVSPAADGKIYACYANSGKVKLINKTASCKHNRHRLAWDQSGGGGGFHNGAPVVVGSAGAPPYESRFAPASISGFRDLTYELDADGRVFLSGLACITSDGAGACGTGVAISGQSVVFHLPAGLRPATQHVYSVMSYNQFAGQGAQYYSSRIDIAPDGSVTLVSPPSAGYQFISFDGINFRAGQ